MKKSVSSIFKILSKVLICLLLFSLWSPLIVPILFYFTFADSTMKAQLLWDWGEFNGMVYSTEKSKDEGITLHFEDKALLVAKKVSDLGFLWIPIGFLWAFSSRISSFFRRDVETQTPL